jgi:protein-S-isoprenylcysteine O-methyltransferase Ste14
VPLLHWLPVIRFVKLQQQGMALSFPQAMMAGGGQEMGVGGILAELTGYDLLGSTCLALATWLNWAAARALGLSYDRLVVPAGGLVTTGVYSCLRHPIYTSYMLLFTGFSLCLHSAPYALLMLAACAAYYRWRSCPLLL